MSECSICKDNVKDFDRPRAAHLVVHQDHEGHIHVHGDINKKDNMAEMIAAIHEHTGIAYSPDRKTFNLKEVVFHNRQRIGDMLMFTCGVRDFKAAFPHVRVNVISTAGHIWDHNPNIDRTLVPTDANTIKIGPGTITNGSNSKDWHFANGYRVSIEEKLGVVIPQGESRPDIYFAEEEYNAPRLFADPYWIICITGEKGWGCKMYPADRWQRFVEQNPDKLFVQIGAKEDNPPRLIGKNVIDHVGKTQDKETGIRDLFKLFLNAEGSVGLVSFHMHLSGALNKPCVVVAGAREPVHFTRYPGHAYLATDGMLPCATKACWHCALSACTNLVDVEGRKVELTKEERQIREPDPEFKKLNDRLKDAGDMPRCVHMIEPEDLTRAINGYYIGGRLQIGRVSEKPKLKNIVKAPISKDDKLSLVKDDILSRYDMKFGGATITAKDWDAIKSLMADKKSILEFGVGLSTLLLNDIGKHVVSYETTKGWRNKILAKNPKCDIRLWDGISADILEHFDVCLVDGPSGGDNREHAVRIASLVADTVIVHDGYGAWEQKWQDKYLVGSFSGPKKIGDRAYLWERIPEPASRDIVQPGANPQGKQGILEGDVNVEDSPKYNWTMNKAEREGYFGKPVKKLVKIVSTARGWGGCARSVTTIMKYLLKEGCDVEFIPFRNKVSSREFQEILKTELKDVRVLESYDSIKEPCDTILVYADDFVWEFDKLEIAEAFSDVVATRKVMMVNYRRGGVGEIPWTKNWDKYMFLNSTQEGEVLKVHPRVLTKVLPPCTELERFFQVEPNYNTNLRIVRHSSQGDTKFSKYIYEDQIHHIFNNDPNSEIHMLPGPSWVKPAGRFYKYNRTADNNVLVDFLGKGNVFWYALPLGYMDAGPRVILEAMAAGLPVVADAWGGALDRVTPETGWLCKATYEHVNILLSLTPDELKRKGAAARERAYSEFRPERWVKELVY